MAEPYKFELVSPERLLVSEEVEWVVVPGTEGEMTVMVQHAPTMAVIKPGLVRVRFMSGEEERFVVYGGFADILPDTCTILAESAVRMGDLDREDLRRRIEETRSGIQQAGDEEEKSQLEEFLHHLAALEHTVEHA
jgi:F-type H+-transporting ATPase subunit epsilon